MLSRVWKGDWKVTQTFSSTHNGVDIGTPNNTPLYAPEDGSIYATVTVPERNGEKYIAFKSSDGHRVLIYVHIGKFAAVGKVFAGALVALSDNTGYSTGPHTHFTYRVNGVEKDPMPYLKGGETVEMYKGKTIKYWYDNCMAFKKQAMDLKAQVADLTTKLKRMAEELALCKKGLSGASQRLAKLEIGANDPSVVKMAKEFINWVLS